MWIKLVGVVVSLCLFSVGSLVPIDASTAEFPVFEDIFALSSGELWNKMTPEMQSFYLQGVIDGIQNQYLFARLYQDELVDELSDTIMSGKQEAAESSLTKFSLKNSLTANLTTQIPVEKLIQGLNMFYKDNRNGHIPIVLASTVVYLEHSGYDQAEVASHIKQLRSDSERYSQTRVGKR